ncbi:efflux RND transporter periplasmic adaptor subunit [Pantoea coffeiphila]|uniref:efflux RND transporter periplasmic adaptor subunit n=1 Tax=Pantoea coffeiphila TaxID=1465635 RepID=UPI00196207D6|nr:efflux RND transporter periplasmic adaptor subunit [Pantoea coffeiphila]MBM7343205.1 multidrug efflux system membrane fusion protein [Pantoea coffeiphila]
MKIKGRVLLLAAVVLSIAGCGQDEDKTAVQSPDATKVTVTSLEAGEVSVTHSWPGRVVALRTAQIRPQVGGIVTARLFAQGSEVKAGQPLFQIDPAPFRAEVAMAEATLARVEASHRQLQQKANRLSQIQHSGAVSRQDFDDALANSAQAAASVAEAKASLQRKKLDLAYSTVKAPVSGRIDQEFVTEGALVSAADTQAMAIVQQTEKVYVDARLPASELRQIIDSPTADEPSPNALRVSLLDEAGKPYDVQAKLLFSGVSVNNETGDVVLRIVADNPARVLLPGMYIRVSITRHIAKNGLVIPGQAIQRLDDGNYVWTVDGDGAARKIGVELAGESGQGEIVKSGLQAGTRLVVEGQDKLQEGMRVTAVPLKPRA